MTSPTPDRCRSCSAPIVWAESATGKSMPVDVEPAKGGTIRLDPREGRSPRAVVVKPPHDFGRTDLHWAHHATCPQGAQWRRARAKRGGVVTRVYYDTEFIEDGRTIDLISIALVTDHDDEYYAVNKDAPWKRIRKHDWLMRNVVPYLPQGHGDERNSLPRSWQVNFFDPRVKPEATIATEVSEFLLDLALRRREPIELWAYYGAYDHVVLAQMFGTMIRLPRHIPMWTNDIRQAQSHLADRFGEQPVPEQPTNVHNALADARHVRTMWHALFDPQDATPADREATR